MSSTYHTGERLRAHLRAHECLETLQYQTANVELDALLHQAQRRDWPEVEFTLRYAEFTQDTSRPDPTHADCERSLSAMRAVAARMEDIAAEVIVVACDVRLRRIVHGDLRTVDRDEMDLARALARLSSIEPGTVFCGSAYIACALAYAQCAVLEVERDLYRLALQTDAHLAPAFNVIAQRNAWTVAQHCIALELDLACEQFELGDREAAATAAADALTIAMPAVVHLPRPRRESIDAERALLAALARQHELPGRLTAHDEMHPGTLAYLHLAAAVSALDDGDLDSAADAAERAVSGLEGDMIPSIRVFALSIAAQRPPVGAAAARYRSALVQERWNARQRSVLSARARIESERLKMEHQGLEERAFTDEVTGVANRHAYRRHLDELANSDPGTPIAVVMCDVDKFKNVNDTFGHSVGDVVLRDVASIIVQHLRPDDLVARLGGDEFVAVLHGADYVTAAKTAARLLSAITDHPWDEIAPAVHVGLSVGVAAGTASELFDLVLAADESLYQAKGSGRGRIGERVDTKRSVA